MKSFLKRVSAAVLTGALCAGVASAELNQSPGFMGIDGPDLITPQGEKFFIRGTNLGNWLNPEGYMFGFSRTNSARQINDLFCELAGPDFTASFWQAYKDAYITEADIKYIASTGANTVRMPFHYKLFTDEDYMGLNSAQDGFRRIDDVVSWCRNNNLYLILDMHDAPGGQTGDNIDDSYGYPWLFESPAAQQKFINIWQSIAARYKDEPVILGYELMNEPIAHYFDNKDELNALLEPLYERCVAAIREVDTNHIILLGGSQWNSNFEPLSVTPSDPLVMYTCHRYGGPATADAIRSYIDFRDKSNRPMYMGEIGHNTEKWQDDFATVLEDNNIGYTFWPYKKCNDSCIMGVTMPEGWAAIVSYSEGPNATFAEIREAAPDRAACRQAMTQYLDSILLQNCTPQTGYITSMHLTPRDL